MIQVIRHHPFLFFSKSFGACVWIRKGLTPKLSIQYFAALVQLLEPLRCSDHLSRNEHMQITNLVLRHAKAGVYLLMRYREEFSSRYLCPFQLFCITRLCDAIVRFDSVGDSAVQSTRFCIVSLEDAKSVYPLAGPLQKMFRLALADDDIPVPDELEWTMSSAAEMGPKQFLEACTKLTYRQQISRILRSLDRNISRQFISGWRERDLDIDLPTT